MTLKPFTQKLFTQDLFTQRLFTQTGLFPGNNIQVTSGTPEQARSESIIAVNPRDPNNLIAAAKKFSNPLTYRFTVGIRVSFDGGASWQDATLPTLSDWPAMVGNGGEDAPGGMTDPAVVFDSFGNAFMVGEPITYKPDGVIDTFGMYVYKSTDGGLHWSAPAPLHVHDLKDDKSWIACDNNPTSPHFGNVYIAWGASSPLRFARSTDHGQSWKGIGNETPGSALADATFAPEISVGLDGTVHIVWFFDGEGEGPGAGTTIEYMRSINGGETFERKPPIVAEVHGLRGNLPEINTWPHFPGANFRVITLATGCGFGVDPRVCRDFRVSLGQYGKEGAVPWPDARNPGSPMLSSTSC